MATIFDTVKMVEEFSNTLGQKPATAVPTTPAYETGKKVGQLVGGGAGWLSKILKAVPGLTLGGEAVGDAMEGNTAGAVARGAAAVGSVAAGVPGRAFAGGILGGELAAQGVASFADAMNPQKPVLAPAFASEVQKAGGAAKYTDDVQMKIQAEADAAGKQVTADRTARVNQVIADSQAARAQDAQTTANDERMERRMMIENAIARVKTPDAKLFKGGFGTLGQLLAETGQYVSKRGQLNRLAKQEFTAQEKELDRGSAQQIASNKILADFQKAMKPDIRIGNVKSLTGEQPVIFQNGVPTNTVTVDDKGRVTQQPVASRPTTAQAHAEAKAVLATSANKAFTKQQINERLKAQGYPTLP